MRRALVLGLRDYVEKNGFSEVVLGVSGGIDSALTAALCVDALGAGARALRLDAVALLVRRGRGRMRGSSRENLGCPYLELPIETVAGAFADALRERRRRARRGSPPRTCRRGSAARC